MGILETGLASLLCLFRNVFSRLLTDELKQWCPWMTVRLIKYAVQSVPLENRSRLEEEWSSHIKDVPGDLGKIITALGFILAARRISSIQRSTSAAEDSPTAVLKRLLDLALSAGPLLMAFPLMVCVWVALRIERSGPVISARETIGRGGRRFKRYRFETPLPNGQSDQRSIVGRFLERYELDQLPRLINVLRGDMSLVGPAPVPPRRFEQICALVPEYRKVASVKPGIVGVAQLVRLTALSPLDEETLKTHARLEIRYLDKTGVLDYSLILLSSVTSVFSRRAGAVILRIVLDTTTDHG